jgi:hypothetical protein
LKQNPQPSIIPQVEITGLAICIEIILVVARAHPSPAQPSILYFWVYSKHMLEMLELLRAHWEFLLHKMGLWLEPPHPWETQCLKLNCLPVVEENWNLLPLRIGVYIYIYIYIYAAWGLKFEFDNWFLKEITYYYNKTKRRSVKALLMLSIFTCSVCYILLVYSFFFLYIYSWELKILITF